MSTAKKIVATLLCVLSVILGTGYFLGLAFFQTHFKPGTTINGFHCSFKSVDDADALLSREVQSYAMALNTRNNGVEKISADDVGLTFVGRSTLIDIINNQDYKLWFIPELKEYNLPVDCYNIDDEKLDVEMAKLKCMNNMVKSESAHIVNIENLYQVSPAIRGTELDKDKARNIIETAIRQWKPNVDLEEAGCYIDAETVDEDTLQKRCDLLNSIQDTIITYDFGDRKETVDFEKIQKNFINDNYELSSKKIQKYMEKLAKKYDTIGAERKFITYDDRTAIISGGDYGWEINVNDSALALMNLITEDTVDVVEPLYAQTAVSRLTNDIGHSYLEIDASNGKVVLYIDGKPVVQSIAKLGKDIKPGVYKVSSKQEATDDGLIKVITFGESALYQYNEADSISFSGNADISAFASNGVRDRCAAIDATGAEAIFNNIQETWPVIVYDNSNIGG